MLAARFKAFQSVLLLSIFCTLCTKFAHADEIDDAKNYYKMQVSGFNDWASKNPNIVKLRLLEATMYKMAPYVGMPLSPAASALSMELFKTWKPAFSCDGKITEQASPLKVVGEDHDLPNCALDRERFADEAAKDKALLLFESGLVGDSTTPTNIRNYRNLKFRKIKDYGAKNNTPIVSLDYSELNFLIESLNLSKAMPAELAKNPKYQKEAMGIAVKDQFTLPTEKLGSKAAFLWSLDLMKTSQNYIEALLLYLRNRKLFSEEQFKLLEDSKAQFTALMKKPMDIPAHIAADNLVLGVANSYTGAELKTFADAEADFILNERLLGILQLSGIQAPLAQKTVDLLKADFKAKRNDEVELITRVMLRSFFMASQIVKTYCSSGLNDSNRTVIALMGNNHTYGIETLLRSALPHAPLEVVHSSLQIFSATAAQRLQLVDDAFKEIE